MYSKRLIIPIFAYESNEEGSIYSLLGSDIEIKEYKRLPILTTTNSYIVDVKYDMIDFNPLQFYKIQQPKKLNLNSDKYVTEIEGKLVKISSLDAQTKELWIKIYACKQETEGTNIRINYYGLALTTLEDIFHSVCSIFGSSILSYHGSSIKPKFTDKKFNSVCSKYKLDITKDTKAYQQLRSVSSSDYVDAYYDITYFKSKDINKLDNAKDVEDLKKYSESVLDCGNYTPTELQTKLNTLKTGIIILSNERSCPYSLTYINNEDYKLSNYMIEHIIVVMTWDTYNANEIDL